MYVPSRQQVAVVAHTTSCTRPTPIRQVRLIVYKTTNARLRRHIETTNLMNRHTILRCDILQYLHVITVGKVTDLPAPATAHAPKHQVHKDDGVVTAAKVVGEHPLEVTPAVADALMEAVRLSPLAFAVVETTGTSGEIAATEERCHNPLP